MVLSKVTRGFSILEPLLAGSLLTLLAFGIVTGLVYGQEQVARAHQYQTALFLAQEGIEAVRNLRDEDFSNLSAGTYGLAIVNDAWTLVPDEDTNGIFVRSITITDESVDIKNVVSFVTWDSDTGTKSSYLETQLSNWSDL